MADKKTVPRSTSYPVMNVEDALNRLVKLRDSMGLAGEYKRETVANGIGYSTITGTSARAVAALVHYGLLTRNKDVYSISPLGHRYLVPNTDTDVPEAVRDAALNPRLFEAMFNEFKGQVLPKLIANILVSKYGVQDKVAPSIVKLFVSTVSYAGLIGSNGVLGETSVPRDANSIGPVEKDASDNNPNETKQHDLAPVQLELQPGGEHERAAFNEQGINRSGDSWSLNVILRTAHHLDREKREKVRDLLDAADELADCLHALDQSRQEGDNE